MLQFHHPGDPPSLDEVRLAFGLDEADVDAEYGVVATDPADGLYVVRVADVARASIDAALGRRPKHPAEGLFGDPRVEPMGPGDDS